MKLTKLILVPVLAAALATSLNAKETPATQLNLEQSYLSHWFSVDSAEPISLSLTPIEGFSDTDRVKLSFISDDGQTVNGILAYPTNKTGSNKLALAMHPMGTDQQFWWSDKIPLPSNELTSKLRKQGYTVITLDARRHGERGDDDFGPRELLKRAHSDEPRLYIDTIIGSVRDYRIALNWAKLEFKTDEILVMGYSMGAQMSLLLASYEPSIDSVLVMVPPYVGSPTSPVSPRTHVGRINDANVLWLAGTKDPHSDQQQTKETFNKISAKNKTLTWFDAGHRLPNEFAATALSFLDSLTAGSEQ